jgi:hypothetical protein
MSISSVRAVLRMSATAWIVACSVWMPGCAAAGSGLHSGFETPLGSIKIDVQAGQMTVKINGDQHLELTFKDDDGRTIPGVVSVDGPIDQDFPLPEGYASYDYIVTDKESPKPSNDVSAAVERTSRRQVNCTSNFLDDQSLHGFIYQISTNAPTEAEAWSKFEEVESRGPGAAVSGDIAIDAWVDVQAGATMTTVTSALKDGFESYVITVNGAIVADLTSSQNAVLQPLPNGWNRVTSLLPNSLAGSGATVSLSQRGAASSAASVSLGISDI